MTTPHSSVALGLGVVGAGRFAAFLLDAVDDLPDVRVAAVTDHDPGAAAALAKRHDATAYDGVPDLLEDTAVDVLVVATPPATHAALTIAALEAGRHVFCEKPLATTADDLAAVVSAAERSDRVVVVDHVLRHNPLLRAVQRLQEDLTGRPYRFLFENDASDEDLADDHWFWDEAASGGIFVEHGVHFFDAAAMLVHQPVTAVQGASARRAGGPVDLVTATAHHGEDALATHTHSFTHAHRCERQLMRLDHGAAETRVEGWIPVVARIDAWTDDAGARVCEELTTEVFALDGFRLGPQAGVEVTVERDAAEGSARGRGRRLDVPHHATIELTLGGHDAKAAVYAESVRAAMADLVRGVRTGVPPRSGLAEGAAAVAVALAATEATRTQTTVHLSGGSR
jgi:predicted dehydrogenase